jgi:hypothetical protein
MFGTPKIVNGDPVGMLVILVEDQGLKLPDFVGEDEVLRTEMFGGVALLVE